jgi:streptogramin lyase
MQQKFKKYYLFGILLLAVSIISCDKEIFTGFENGIPKVNNKLYIESNPEKALIYLDQRNTGIKTPDTLQWLSEGKHTITIKHEFFIDTVLTVDMMGGTVNKLIVDHYKNPGHMGRLSCQTNPDKADIYIDDVPTNKKTPYTFGGIMPGIHKVKFTYPLHRSDSVSIAVIGGDVRTAYFFLDDTSKGLFYTTTNSKIPTDNTYVIAIDSSNVKWIGTEGQGVIRFDGKNWSVLNKNNSPLTSNIVKYLYVDKTNKLWIGLENGLFVYDGSSFINYSSQVNSRYITSIISDNSGAVWIGAFGGLFRYNGSTWKTFTTENSGLPTDLIYSLAVDKQNNVWVGTNGSGIAVYDGILWKKWDMSNMGIGSRIGDIIHSLACDADGNIWAAHMREELQLGSVKSEGGLSRFNGTKWSIISVPQINTQYIQAVHIDRNNSKWIATKFGLGRFSSLNAASLFTKVNAKLQSNLTTAAALDKTGDLYITTLGGGLSKFRKGNF